MGSLPRCSTNAKQQITHPSEKTEVAGSLGVIQIMPRNETGEEDRGSWSGSSRSHLNIGWPLDNLLWRTGEIVIPAFVKPPSGCISMHRYIHTHPVDRPLPLAIDHGHAYFLTSFDNRSNTACTALLRYRSVALDTGRSLCPRCTLNVSNNVMHARCKRCYKSSSRASFDLLHSCLNWGSRDVWQGVPHDNAGVKPFNWTLIGTRTTK